jgi:hypothetical protein
MKIPRFALRFRDTVPLSGTDLFLFHRPAHSINAAMQHCHSTTRPYVRLS